jgi:hypothetical protein
MSIVEIYEIVSMEFHVPIDVVEGILPGAGPSSMWIIHFE